MREITRSFEEFKARADTTKPIHHSGAIITNGGFIQKLVFRIYGVDKNHGHILIYELQKPTPFADTGQIQKEYRRLVEKYAKPLGSTEGAWME